MTIPKTTERIISEAELQQKTASALTNAQKEPVGIIRDDRPATYVISVDLFDALLEQLALLDEWELRGTTAQAEAEFASRRFKTLAETR